MKCTVQQYVPILGGGGDIKRALLRSLSLFSSVSYFSVGTTISYTEKDQNDKYSVGDSFSQTCKEKCDRNIIIVLHCIESY